MSDDTDCQVLDESDFQEVRKEVSKLTANWQALGSALGLSRSATREIDLANRGDPSRCLDGVIEKWLNQDYNYEKFGLPTWKKLVAAVESNSGGKDPALAKKIGLARFTANKQAEDKVLDESDFQEVRRNAMALTAYWQAFGLTLGISGSAINEIDLANRGDPSRCLDGVIEKWLNQDYNYEKFGLPTWKKLVAAVQSNSGGKDPALAKKIGLAAHVNTEVHVHVPQPVQMERSEVPIRQPVQLERSEMPIRQPVQLERSEIPIHVRQPVQLERSEVPIRPPVQLERSEVPIHKPVQLERSEVPIRPPVQLERSEVPIRPHVQLERSEVPIRPPVQLERSEVPIRQLERSEVPIRQLERSEVPIHQLERSEVPIHQLERSEVPITQPVQLIPPSQTANIISRISQIAGQEKVTSQHIPHTEKMPLPVKGSDGLTSRSQFVPSVAASRNPYIHELRGPDVNLVEATNPRVISARSLMTTDPPVLSTRTTDPPVPSTRTTDLPVPSTRTTDPPVPSTRTTDPPVPSASTTDPPVPSTRTTHPPVPSTRTTHPPVPSTRTTHPPVPSTRTTHPPVVFARTTNPPVPSTRTTDLPVASTRTTDPPVPSTRITDPPVPSTRTTDPPVPSTRTTDPPVVLTRSSDHPVPSTNSSDHPAGTTVPSARITDPSALPQRYAVPRPSEPLALLHTHERIQTRAFTEVETKVDSVIGLKALLNDLARFDSKWYNIGVLLMVPVNELNKIPIKSNEILCLQNVLIRWLSLTPTPMKSDLVKMLQSNAIDDHTLARVLQRDPDLPDTRPLGIDDFDAILSLLSPLSRRWEDIAIQLDVDTRQLPSMESTSSSNAVMLRMMLQKLQGVAPPPTLHDLVDALSSSTIGQRAYAEELMQKYCPSGSPKNVLLFLPGSKVTQRVEMDYKSIQSEQHSTQRVEMDYKSILSEQHSTSLSPSLGPSENVPSVYSVTDVLSEKESVTEQALDRQANASGHEANKNQESLKLSSSTNGPLSGVFCTMVSEATSNPEQGDQSLVLGVRHTTGPRATDAAASAEAASLGRQATARDDNDKFKKISLQDDIIKQEVNDSCLSLQSTGGPKSNRFCTGAISAEPSLHQQNIVNMNASEHEASSNLKLLSSTNGPLSNTMVSEATTNPEQDDQSLVGVRHTNGPRATDAAASAEAASHGRQATAGDDNDKFKKISLQDDIIKQEVNDSCLSLQSTGGPKSNRFCTGAISAEPSLHQQNIVDMNASEHEASSNLKLLSSTNGPLSNTMVSEATTNPEQDDQSFVLGVQHTTGPRATDAAASAEAASHGRQATAGDGFLKISLQDDVIKQEVNDSSLLLQSTAGPKSSLFCTTPTSAEPAFHQQNIVNTNAEASSNLKLLSSTNGPLSNSMVSEATTNPEQGDQSFVLGVQHTTGPRATDAAASAEPELDQQALAEGDKDKMELTSPTLNDNVTKQDSNELIVASNITQYSSNEFLSLDELRNTATVEDEDESMMSLSNLQPRSWSSLSMIGQNSSQLSGIPGSTEYKKIATVEDEEESIKHCDNVQSINSTIANNSNRFVVPASQATDNLEGDHSLVVPLNPHSTAADFTAENKLTDKELRSVARLDIF